MTIKNCYPLPLISELLDRIKNAKYYMKLDLRDAFNQLHIALGNEWKTAFRTRYSPFEYLNGLTNTPASMQAYANDCLRDYLDLFCIVYLDDILIYSNTLEEHVTHVHQVLTRLREYGLCCNERNVSCTHPHYLSLALLFHPQAFPWILIVLPPSLSGRHPRMFMTFRFSLALPTSTADSLMDSYASYLPSRFSSEKDSISTGPAKHSPHLMNSSVALPLLPSSDISTLISLSGYIPMPRDLRYLAL